MSSWPPYGSGRHPGGIPGDNNVSSYLYDDRSLSLASISFSSTLSSSSMSTPALCYSSTARAAVEVRRHQAKGKSQPAFSISYIIARLPSAAPQHYHHQHPWPGIHQQFVAPHLRAAYRRSPRVRQKLQAAASRRRPCPHQSEAGDVQGSLHPLLRPEGPGRGRHTGRQGFGEITCRGSATTPDSVVVREPYEDLGAYTYVRDRRPRHYAQRCAK